MRIKYRKVMRLDLEKVIDLLQAISSFRPGDASMDRIWRAFEAQPNVFGVVAVQSDPEREDVIGYGSLCLDLKIRGGAIGHIEDIVVAHDFRRQGVGNRIVQALVELARIRGCYKVSLECRDDKAQFYEPLGFSRTGCAMSMLLGQGSSRIGSE